MAPQPVALAIFLALFALVSALGFYAARWRRGDLDKLEEWGLAGRRFGTWVTWFLIGGDLYTAYTFVAVPALVYGSGAIGLFAVPYTVFVYPLMFLIFPKFWEVAKAGGHVTAADYVAARFDNRWLALAVALTGLLATMPYIALQLVGLEVVIAALGLAVPGLGHDVPIAIAFAVLAAFTYTGGLRAPALIAIVKDLLIYATVIAAIIAIPAALGGFERVFAAVPPEKLLLAAPTTTSIAQFSAYPTLALGSAVALLLYPHFITGVLGAGGPHVIRRNAALLPAYSVVLGLLALMGFMALASGVGQNPAYAQGFKEFGATFAVPALFLEFFPPWFVGIAFAAIGIGALVPAAIMSIAAANLWTRNVHRPFLDPRQSEAGEARTARIVSLVVKFGALAFIIELPQTYVIQLQLLGGIWMIQTLPAVILSLFLRGLDGWAVLTGWAVGMITGSAMAFDLGLKSSVFPLEVASVAVPGYAAVWSVLANIATCLLLTPILRATRRGASLVRR